MKKIKYLILAAIVSVVVFQAISFSSGGFGDSTGGVPKKNVVQSYSTCSNSGCHVGYPLNESSLGYSDIITNIPETGWIPGQTYQVKASIQYPGKLVFGFQMMAWGDVDSASVGKLTAVNKVDSAKITNSILRKSDRTIVDTNQYATHKSTSLTSHGSNRNEWTFNWTAPNVRNQKVIFYGSFLAANGNGATSGDRLFRISKNADSSSIPILGLEPKEMDSKNLSVYPTIVKDQINIDFNKDFKNMNYEIFNIQGKKVLNNKLENLSNHKIYLQDLPKGNYVLWLNNSNFKKSYQFIKE